MEKIALIFSILSNAAFLALLGCAFAAVVRERRAEKRPDPKFKVGDIVYAPNEFSGAYQGKVFGFTWLDNAWFYDIDGGGMAYIRETELEAH